MDGDGSIACFQAGVDCTLIRARRFSELRGFTEDIIDDRLLANIYIFAVISRTELKLA